MMELSTLLPALARADVRFIVVGGVAAALHGAARATFDLDVVYDRDRANLDNLSRALAPFNPYLRGAPPGLPFRLDADTIEAGLNFTLTTSAGDIDLLGELTGGGTYRDLLEYSGEITAWDSTFRAISLPKLIQVKRAAGRPKDFEAIAELELLLELRGKQA